MGLTFEESVIEFEKVVKALIEGDTSKALTHRLCALRSHASMLRDAARRGRHVEGYTHELAIRFSRTCADFLKWAYEREV